MLPLYCVKSFIGFEIFEVKSSCSVRMTSRFMSVIIVSKNLYLFTESAVFKSTNQ